MKFIIPIIVGAIIGYATNWLAIKMLFRPHYEKRFMGIKIPFTPGLIPKEKERISKNIGETVGQYLLSPETIAETLSSEKTNEQIKFWIGGRISKLKDSGKSIKDLLVDLSQNAYDGIVSTMEKSINSLIITQIRSEKAKDIILDFTREKLYEDRTYEEISKGLRVFLEEIVESNELKLGLETKIGKEFEKLSKDERILIDCIPEKLILELNRYLDENSDDIANHIRQIIDSPSIQNKLKTSIAKMVDQNVSRLITSFIQPEVISEKIYVAIEKYINNVDSNKDIILIIKAFLNRVMELKVSELVPEILNKINPMEVSKYIIGYAGHMDNQDKIISIIDEKLKRTNRERIMENLSERLDTILNSDKLGQRISLFINDIMVKLMDKPVSTILAKVEPRNSKIYDFIKVIFDNFARNEIPHIMELFNISKIVEDEINKFDVEFTEKLILDIANKELKAITWLGALLGGIMGLLSPLLQML